MSINIQEILREEIIFVHNDFSKKELLEDMISSCEKTLNIGTLNSLRESILKKEEACPNMTAIGNSLAIPHGIFFDYSYEIDMFVAIAKVENGVDGYDSMFDCTKAKYVFLIAYNQDTYCTQRTAIMPIIATFFSNEENIKLLDNAKTSNEIYNILMEKL